MKYIEVLKRCDIFRNVSEENIFEILKVSDGKIKKFKDKQIICRKNTPCKELGIVLYGQIYAEGIYLQQGRSFCIEEAASESTLGGDINSAGSSEILFINFKKLIKCSGMG